MIGVSVKPIRRANFFDSAAVMKALNAAERRVLSKFGAFVRQGAKSSIRPAIVLNRKEIRAGKKIGRTFRKVYAASKPGEAPRSRRGDLKRLIVFGYDFAKKSVVVGPKPIGGRRAETPGRLEAGGTFRSRSGKLVRVLKRPYMKPAFDRELRKMPGLWTDSIQASEQ